MAFIKVLREKAIVSDDSRELEKNRRRLLRLNRQRQDRTRETESQYYQCHLQDYHANGLGKHLRTNSMGKIKKTFAKNDFPSIKGGALGVERRR